MTMWNLKKMKNYSSLTRKTEVVLVSTCNKAQHVLWEMNNVITFLGQTLNIFHMRSISPFPGFGLQWVHCYIAMTDFLFCITVRPLLIML